MRATDKCIRFLITLIVCQQASLAQYTLDEAVRQYGQAECPTHLVAYNGSCYWPNQIPSCPLGYQLWGDKCYPITTVPCPYTTTTELPYTTTELPYTTTELPYTTTELPYLPVTTSTAESTITEMPDYPEEQETTTTTEEEEATTDIEIEEIYTPAPAEFVMPCPKNSVLINNVCRKLVCPQGGEYHEGLCLQPVCPEGTVWRGRRCQEPAYITTILEIENVIMNEARHTPGVIEPAENINRVDYHTEKPTQTTSTTTARPRRIKTTPAPGQLIGSTTSKPPIKNDFNKGCCSIITPRLCRQYGQKWVCFNRRYKRCDAKLCTAPVIYLKAPKAEIGGNPPMLVMPPNPPLQACKTSNCSEAETVDCSGCAHNDRQRCSPYCYHYMCPMDSCHYIDLEIFCGENPDDPVCTKKNGCIWNWCNDECNNEH